MSQQAVLVAGNLVSFAKDVTEQDRQDVMDLMLYADLSASKKYDQTTLSISWLNHYQQRLIKFGCELKAFIDPETLFASDLQSFYQLTCQVYGSVGSIALSQQLRASFSALDLDQTAMDLFQRSMGNARSEIIKATPCELTASNELMILFCAIKLTSTVDVEGFLFWKETFRDLSIRPDGGVFLFRREIYDRYRAGIRSRLAGLSEQFFHPLKAPQP